MRIKLSSHARFRLKERFSRCPAFGGKLRENKLKFIEAMPHQDAKVYRYNWCKHDMYLFIVTDGTIITILTPQMYRAWSIRGFIANTLSKITKFFGIRRYECHKFAKMLVPMK